MSIQVYHHCQNIILRQHGLCKYTFSLKKNFFKCIKNFSWKSSPSPAEIATIIAQAKQASASVLIAQQQVQAAKENVSLQQKLASEKESQAAIALQKTEVRLSFIDMQQSNM